MDLPEKHKIYVGLFFQRTNVFARHNGKYWTPVYLNNQTKALKPLDSIDIDHHFTGIQRLGSYSTTPGTNLVKFIVADFDANPLAFQHCIKLRDKLNEFGLRSYPLRSNSGVGFHLWMFFSSEILASVARQMMIGALLLASVPVIGHVKKHGVTERSFDRLIPAQNSVPIGGTGNLISLPLNGLALQKGNTAFVDDEGEVIEDQWGLLKDIYNNHRVDPKHSAISELGKHAPRTPKAASEMNANETYDYWEMIRNFPDQLKRLTGCEAIKQSFSNANTFQEPPWADILSNIAIFTLAISNASEARELAHLISEGHDTYNETETEEKLEYKKDHLMRGGWPTSCLKMAEHGWMCPRLKEKSCHCGFIAKFGVPPSFAVHDLDQPITLKQRKNLYQLEKVGIYEKYREWVYTDKIKINIIDKKTSDYKWIPVDLSDEKIARHLLGLEEFQVRTVSKDWSKNRSIHIQLKEEEVNQVLEKLTTNNISHWKASNSEVWIICSDEMRTKKTNQVLQENYSVSSDIYNFSIENYDFSMNEWQVAPFYNDLVAVERLLQEEKTNANVQ